MPPGTADTNVWGETFVEGVTVNTPTLNLFSSITVTCVNVPLRGSPGLGYGWRDALPSLLHVNVIE